MKTEITYLKSGLTKIVPTHHANILVKLKVAEIKKPIVTMTTEKTPEELQDIRKGSGDKYQRRDMQSENASSYQTKPMKPKQKKETPQ